MSRLKLAAQLAEALRNHPSKAQHRIFRAIRAFREAYGAPGLDFWLHQFVRCVEGFVAPYDATQFADRLSRISAGRRKKALQEIYRIRSGIEHHTVHIIGPIGGKDLRLAHRCIQAEAVTRYMLGIYLLHPQLWNVFRDQTSADTFWKQHAYKIRKVWPSETVFDRILGLCDTHESTVAFDAHNH